MLKLSYIVTNINIAHTPSTVSENPRDVDFSNVLNPISNNFAEFGNILSAMSRLLNGIYFTQSLCTKLFIIAMKIPFPIYSAIPILTETAVFLVTTDNIIANSANMIIGIDFTKYCSIVYNVFPIYFT